MKNDRNTLFTHADFSITKTQQYLDAEQKIRGEALSEHISTIKNLFKRKSSVTKFKK